MIKYVETFIGLREVPDEIALCINISGCPNHCEGCHSSYLAEDIGTELTFEELEKLIKQNSGISTICFMGGDNDHESLVQLCREIRQLWPHLKLAMYSGCHK